MHKAWLLFGVALAWGCSSPPSEKPGGSASTAGNPPAAVGGAPSSTPAGAGAAGIASVVPGTAGAPQTSAGTGARAGASGQSSPAGQGGGGGQGGQAGPAGNNAQAGRGSMAGSPAAGSGGGSSAGNLAHFSFFVTSMAGLQKLSGKQEGFGGDLRHGQANGLAGADKICNELAESSMPGAAAKGWRAFLSVAQGPDGKQVNAIDRVGEGPWYDRLGRVVAMTKAALLNPRPQGADPAIINDLPNEEGVPNQRPDPSKPPVNNHHFLTGSDATGKLYGGTVNSTCNNWTSTAQSAGRPRIGFSYPAGNRQHWISGQDEGGCGAGAVLVDQGGSDPSNPIVGSGGGYGGFYCFALMP